MSAAAMILLAWAIEATVGWPKRLYDHIRHPVVWMGALISILERALNETSKSHRRRYAGGVLTTVSVVGISGCVGYGIEIALPNSVSGFVIEAVLASSLIASRSLYEHVANVATPLVAGDLAASRLAVSQIVGRDPETLDRAAVARASLETLAENASDGVIAPVFYGVLFGLPGLAAYKAINTLDSMIGHRSARYLAFGGFAARLDDIVNFIPARLTGLLFAIISLRGTAFKIMRRDAGKHRSPNAGWPESSLAGALGVRLSGPRQYGDRLTQEPWLNAGAADPCPMDIDRGLRLYVRVMMFAAFIVLIIAAVLSAL